MRTVVLSIVLMILLGLVAVPALAAADPKPAEPTFAKLLAQAKRDMATEKGAAYDTVMGQQFAGKHSDTVSACVEASGSSAPDPFKAIIVVAKDGKVTKVALEPETEVAKCLRKVLLEEAFPKPPFAPFHDLMEMSFK
jgi:hypothetical protein